MTGAEFNALIALGRAEAELLEPELIGVYESLVVWAGKQAARGFRQLPVLAAADWNPPRLQDVLDEQKLQERVVEKTRPVQQRMLVKQAGHVLGTAGIDWTIRHPLSQELLDQLAARSTDIADGIRGPVATVIAKSFTEGLSVPDTAKAIMDRVGQMKTWQATMLARNDLIGTANGGALMAARMLKGASAEAPGFKQWLSAHDALVRPSHASASGQTVPLDQPFSVGSSYLQHPGDPAGAHADVVNCRCVMLMVDAPAGVKTSDQSNELLPSYSHRDPVEMTHDEAKDELKRLGSYMGLLRWQIKNGKRDAADVRKVEAMDERRKVLRSRLKEPDIDPALRPELPAADPPLKPPLTGESERMRDLRSLNASLVDARNDVEAVQYLEGSELDELTQHAGQLVWEEVAVRVEAAKAKLPTTEEFNRQLNVLRDRMYEVGEVGERARDAWVVEQLAANYPEVRHVRSVNDLWKIMGSHPQAYEHLKKSSMELPEWRAFQAAIKAVTDFEDSRTNFTMLERDITLEVLAEVRQMGGKLKFAGPSATAPKAVLNRAAKHFPAEWVERSNTSPDDPRVVMRPLWAMTRAQAKANKSGRFSSYYNNGYGGIYVDATKYDSLLPGAKKGDGVAIHELMHRMEYSNPILQKLEAAFYDRRTMGEDLRPMGPGYDSWEKFRPDRFAEKYMGKDYRTTRNSPGGLEAWELLTMGAQFMFSGRRDRLDLDYVRFVLGALAIL